MTAAHNEESSIGATIESVVKQTKKPLLWVIVSDGSTDRTVELVGAAAKKHDFIVLLRREKSASESGRADGISAGKVPALRMAEAYIREHASCPYDFLGNLDADIVIGENWFEELLKEFEADPELGLGGGQLINILPDGTRAPGGLLNPEAVGGAVQMFRLQCWKDIGAYKPYGHEDCLANAQSRRAGWKVRSFPRLMGEHHVPCMGYAPQMKYKLPVLFRMGRMAYIMRTPLWAECIVCVARMVSRPYAVGGTWRLAGYVYASLRREVKIPIKTSWLATQKGWVGIFTQKIRRVLADTK
jgi:glycosyltransferase involved in cell wall biosynthesis